MEELGRLLSLISHEVRAPLGVMRGYMRLLEQQGTELSEPHRHVVAAALKASERATEILGQVSVLARLHRGEITVSLKDTPLEPLLRSAAHTVTMPSEPAVTIDVRPTPDVTVMADEALLRAALASVTSAVVRAQAMDNRVQLLTREEHRDGEPGVAIIITAMESESATHTDAPLDVLRGGLGVELPVATFVIDAHRGHLMERREQERFVGIAVWLPTADRSPEA